MSQATLPVNPDLVWDYDLPADDEQSEAFRRWYIARVLSRGKSADLAALGFDTIYAYMPTLELPMEIRRFWEWYFSLPGVKERYGTAHPISAASITGHRP
ncbi:MAG: hypothetical protein AB1791_22090 [Chloroflexota bacterium]